MRRCPYLKEREKHTMTHIQSIFDLCPDIQAQIGDILAPLMKSKKLKRDSIYECLDMMKKYRILQLKEHTFEKCWKTKDALMKFYSQFNLGWLYLVVRFKINRESWTWIAWKATRLNQAQSINQYYKILRVIINYGSVRFAPNITPNIYGIPIKYVKSTECDYKMKLMATHYRLNRFARINGIKMPESWKKDKKIQYLMKTEM